jgi:N-acetylglucosaminyldiphosphoundecaprenol N-acetyl-beta-D-mannosaminyltransferase
VIAPARASERFWLGPVPIDPVTRDEALERISQLVAARAGGTVFTPNVDHVVLAADDVGFRRAYANTSLSLVDGVPVLLAARLLGHPVPEKVSGSDLVQPVVERAAASGWRLYLLGGMPGVAERAAALLRERYPRIVIAGIDAPTIDMETPPAARAGVLERVRLARPDVTLVALGSPKGELWSAEAREALRPSVIIGIGAGLDFLTGAQKRAPAFMSNAGLEWLFRLGCDPLRLWRRYLVRGPRFIPIVLRAHRRRPDSSPLG